MLIVLDTSPTGKTGCDALTRSSWEVMGVQDGRAEKEEQELWVLSAHSTPDGHINLRTSRPQTFPIKGKDARGLRPFIVTHS
jgi:hypothetical protein